MREILTILFLISLLFVFGCDTAQVCTLEAKICPDGSSVGRNPDNNCEFDPCPAVDIMEEYCVSLETGDKLGLTEALEIASDSECNEGEFKDHHFCNENTGTWWIDLNIVKEGCNPACVVNVVTKEAEINWRCTGLL